MAKTGIPDPLTRRHWLSETLDSARARSIAEAYLAEGRVFESIAFLEKAGEREKLLELGTQAMADGDAFLFRAICEVTGEEADASDWQALADAAEAAGKAVYAIEARRQSQALGG